MNTNEPTTPSAIRSGEPLWCADCKSYHPIGLHTDTPSAAPTPETPETEAVMTDPLRDGNDLPALARRLERERDEARAELARLKANNRYQRGYHDGEQAAREELKTPTPPTEGSAVEWAQTKMITREDIDGDLFKCLQEDDAIELARRADEWERQHGHEWVHRRVAENERDDLRAQLASAQAEARELREAAENLIRTVMIPDLEHGSNWRVHQLKNDHVRAMRAALAKKEGER